MGLGFGLGHDVWRQINEMTTEHLDEFRIEEKMILKVGTKLMLSRAKGYHTAIFDTVGYSAPTLKMDEGIVIQIYAPFEDMIRNFISRIVNEPRGVECLGAYGLAYATHPTKSGSIDHTNRRIALKAMQKVRAFFWDEASLTNFVYNIYKRMGIEDDDDHYIAPNPKFCHFDYCVNTRDRTPAEVYRKVLKIIIQNGGKISPI
jgi:hypothetical protein